MMMGEEASRLEGKEARDRSAWEAATASCCAKELLQSGAMLLLPSRGGDASALL